MAFVQRLIKATFVLGEGNFGLDGSDQLEIENARISAKVANAGGRSMGTAQVAIYGMTLSQMNKLSTLGMIVTSKRKNSLTLAGGDASAPLATFFQGTINNAWGAFDGAPNVAFQVLAQTGLFDAVQPATPISIRGSASAADMLSGIATQMGLQFQNNGVTARLSNAYYAGSPRNQALAIVKDAGIEWNAGENGVLAIWNPGQSKADAEILIAPRTGMIKYPTYTANGLLVRTVWNPSIGLGTKVKVESSLTGANGSWVVYKIDHDLESMVPGGQWQSTILAAPPGTGPFVA